MSASSATGNYWNRSLQAYAVCAEGTDVLTEVARMGGSRYCDPPSQ
jgi:hypothetical protein